MAQKFLWVCDRSGVIAVSDQNALPSGWEQYKSWLICPDCVRELQEWWDMGIEAISDQPQSVDINILK